MKAVFKDLGELRIALVSMAVFTIACVPFAAEKEVRFEGFGMLPDVLAPVVAVILVFVLLLDMLMSRIFLGTYGAEKGKRYRTAIMVEAVVLFTMVGSWYAYFSRMLF